MRRSLAAPVARFRRRLAIGRARVARRVRALVGRWIPEPDRDTREPPPATPQPGPGKRKEAVERAIASFSEEASRFAGVEASEVGPVFSRLRDERASYMHQLDTNKRVMALLPHLGARHPYWDINGKSAGYRFVAGLGISHPEILGRYDSVAEIDPGELPDRFLLKPDDGSTNRGVFGLERLDDAWVDRLTGRTLRWSDIVAEIETHVERGHISARLLLEELLRKPGDESAIPDDMKAYVFYDRVVMVMQRDMRQRPAPADWRFKFWNRDWQDVGPVKFADRVDPGLRPPVHGEELISVAERLGKELRFPFIRLDFYDTTRGVVFGEFSMNPGPPEVFVDEFDEYLGWHRELATARLTAESIERGEWDHLDPRRPGRDTDS